jgi:hypothetical protein
VLWRAALQHRSRSFPDENFLAVLAAVRRSSRLRSVQKITTSSFTAALPPRSSPPCRRRKWASRSSSLARTSTSADSLRAGSGFTDTGTRQSSAAWRDDFYHRVWQHYDTDAAWKWQKKSEYGGKGQGTPAVDGAQRTMWIFEPHVAEQVFENYVKEFAIPVVRDEWLDRAGERVTLIRRMTARGSGSITTLSGKTYYRTMFIDATYEGDLMAAAGVSTTSGAKRNAVYGEKVEWRAGRRAASPASLRRGKGKDQSVCGAGRSEERTASSVSAEPPGEYGAGDKRVQAYCFRLCLTNHEPNRVPFPKPEGYDPKQYELLLRIFAAGWRETFEKFDPIPNHKTDTNNHGPFSFDNIG